MLIGVVAILVLVVLIALVVRIYREGDGLGGLFKVLPVFFVAIMAVIVLAQITEEITPYSYDDRSGTLTINGNVYQDYSPWDDYADNIKSLIIQDNAKISSDAFDTLTNLTYVSIGEGAEISQRAFRVTFKDYTDATISPRNGIYAGYGDGTLYKYDSMVLISSGGSVRLNPAVSGVKNVVIPESIDGMTVTATSENGFSESGIVRVVIIGDSLTAIGYRSFKNCASLTNINLPDSVTTIPGESFMGTAITSIIAGRVTTLGNSVFSGCASLASATFESMPSQILANVFKDCVSLESITIPDGVISIGNDSFNGCASLKTVTLPDSLTTINYGVFIGCTGIESVSFGTGLSSIQTNAFTQWTFYESDGVTTLAKTAANLAGKTFQGTAAALVEVLPDRSSLTPDQILKVQLHDAELQDLKDQIALDPLPLRPSLEEELTA